MLFVDARGRDLTWERSLACLAVVADSLPWAHVVQRAVCSEAR